MTGGFLPVPLQLGPGPEAATEVVVRTRIVSEDDGAAMVKKGVPARHELQLVNKHPRPRRFVVTSAVADKEIAYDGAASQWVCDEVVNSRIKKAVTVPRSKGFHHPGVCAANNGHSVKLTVNVSTLLPGEAPDASTALPFYYHLICQC